jgi:hypothetical protein
MAVESSLDIGMKWSTITDHHQALGSFRSQSRALRVGRILIVDLSGSMKLQQQ